MNEQIEKLLVESFFESDDSPSDKIYKINEAMIQKFAELIIQECCEVAHCNSHVGGLTLGNIMKAHFGAEE
jgi:hypothetical protein